MSTKESQEEQYLVPETHVVFVRSSGVLMDSNGETPIEEDM